MIVLYSILFYTVLNILQYADCMILIRILSIVLFGKFYVVRIRDSEQPKGRPAGGLERLFS